jgi:hypothetical protein
VGRDLVGDFSVHRVERIDHDGPQFVGQQIHPECEMGVDSVLHRAVRDLHLSISAAILS